jgi:methionyl-tRNA formyltransferase
MTKDIDAGPIIVQGEVPILFHENSKDVYEKIVALEKQLFRDNLPLILNMNTDGWKPPFGNYNDREDFREMCELDLQSTDTLENHIRLLRSLTFPGYRNAYAQINGHKYFIEISVTPENLEK